MRTHGPNASIKIVRYHMLYSGGEAEHEDENEDKSYNGSDDGGDDADPCVGYHRSDDREEGSVHPEALRTSRPVDYGNTRVLPRL